MKGRYHYPLANLLLFTMVTSGIALSSSLFGQTPVDNSQPPMVTVLATDAQAAEDGLDTGTFAISRSGGTNDSLTVFYSLGGTARNGFDYQMLPGRVTLPAGVLSTNITITPILDVDRTAETNDTVVLRLLLRVDPIPLLGGTYALGWPSNAVVSIAESTVPPTNRPPTVRLINPANGAGFIAPANIQLVAQAVDADGTVTNVEFFAGTISLGSVANLLPGERFRGQYSLDWTNVAAGSYSITAKATDNQGGSTISPPLSITVVSEADIPSVTVVASDAAASELGPDPGTFTVTRTGDTSGALAVFYSLGGTAQNGIDYLRLPGVVNFAAGAPSTNITVTPIPDIDSDTLTNHTVVLQLRPLVDTVPGLHGIYRLGSPSNAVVTIAEDANAFPSVTVLATDAKAAEDGPDTGTFQVTRTGNTATGLTVFYSLQGSARNGTDYKMLSGSVTIAPGDSSTNITITPVLDVDHTPETNETVTLQLRPRLDLVRGGNANPYSVGWPSNAVITIAESANPPTNEPPVVRLISPGDGAGYVAPAVIKLVAQARDSDGSVTNVMFFAGSTSLGTGTNYSARDRGLFSLSWTNVPVGQFALTAVATDNHGANSTSGPVHVVVTQTALPVVSIFASDPIAVTGTNTVGNTNTASFVIRRDIGTNTDLVVYYGISGTASNGVDYVRIPGSLTIPAGSRSASIEIDPLDVQSLILDRQQSIVLTLQAPPSANQNPPTYLVAKQNQAVAIIVDRLSRRNVSGWLGNGYFHAVLPVAQPMTYQVEVSTNLVDWEVVGSNDPSQGSLQFVDPTAAGSSLRFYRTVPDSSPNAN